MNLHLFCSVVANYDIYRMLITLWAYIWNNLVSSVSVVMSCFAVFVQFFMPRTVENCQENSFVVGDLVSRQLFIEWVHLGGLICLRSCDSKDLIGWRFPPIKLQYFHYTFHSIIVFLLGAPSLCGSIVQFIKQGGVILVSSWHLFFFCVLFPSLFSTHATSYIRPAVCMYSLDTLSSCWGSVLLCFCNFAVPSVFIPNVLGKTQNNRPLTLLKNYCKSWERSQRKKVIILQTKYQPKFWQLCQNIDIHQKKWHP